MTNIDHIREEYESNGGNDPNFMQNANNLSKFYQQKSRGTRNAPYPNNNINLAVSPPSLDPPKN